MSDKRILILATARSGSTRLMEWISYELGITSIDEPFNTNKLHNKEKLKNKNVVVKELINHTFNIDLRSFIDSFDIVITLRRENTFECAISLQYSIENHKEHSTYVIDTKWIDSRNEILNELVIGIESIGNIVINTESDLAITYEGIYENKNDITKVCELLEINNPKYLGMLEKKYKLRNNIQSII